jgi:glycosyltransferase involved in cell wall biosynthesis
VPGKYQSYFKLRKRKLNRSDDWRIEDGMEEGKIDLVMWTKNGEFFLPRVFQRIDEVIPSESISDKIIIDDNSTDKTLRIAASFNWKIYPNPEGGVSAGAIEALRHVRSKRFVSVEQDLVLAEDWWRRIPPLLEDEKVVAASGVRLPDKPTSLKLISEYSNERYKLQTASNLGFRYGKTLDNTIYRTDLLRKIGGFPRIRINAGVDGALAKQVNEAGCLWKVDFNVVSLHLRRGFFDELRHGYWYGTESMILSQVLEEKGNVLTSSFTKALFSPLRGLQIALNKKCWEIGLVYPLIRGAIFLGVLRGYTEVSETSVS